jgi:hypothetical protein
MEQVPLKLRIFQYLLSDNACCAPLLIYAEQRWVSYVVNTMK